MHSQGCHQWAHEQASQIADEGAAADLLEVLATRGDSFLLEHAAEAASVAATLLASPRASAGMAMLASLAAWFGEVIRDTYRYQPTI